MKLSDSISQWSRTLHIHLGLFLLLFVWLFSLSGLILNHDWKFTRFWEERDEQTLEFTLPINLLDKANIEREVMTYLNIAGESQMLRQTSEVLEFRVHSPGIVRDVQLQLSSGTGQQKVMRYNIWGKWRTLHTFNGINKEDISQNPNWWITRIWRLTMDALAIGLMLICLSSWIMWLKVRKEYRLGYLVILASLISASYFLWWG